MKDKWIGLALRIVAMLISIILYLRLVLSCSNLKQHWFIIFTVVLFVVMMFFLWRMNRILTFCVKRESNFKKTTLELALYFGLLLMGVLYFLNVDQVSFFTIKLPRHEITIKYQHCNYTALYHSSVDGEKLKLIGMWNDFGREFLCYKDYPSKYAADFSIRPASFIQISALSSGLEKTSAENSYLKLKSYSIQREENGIRIYQHQEQATQENKETIFFRANDGALVMVTYSLENPGKKTMSRKLGDELQVDFIFYTHYSTLDLILNREIDELAFYRKFESNAMATVRSMIVNGATSSRHL